MSPPREHPVVQGFTAAGGLDVPTGASVTRSRLMAGTTLGVAHWIVVVASLGVTFGAWGLANRQQEQKVEDRFDQEAKRARSLIVERLGRYEDALWAGVGAVHAQSATGEIANENWLRFAESLRLQEKYPGISGIGVVVKVSPEDRDAYVARQRLTRPNFSIHPDFHQGESLFPIVHVEPWRANAKAVGLDLAHEANRLKAIERARDSGAAQVTAPIVLVQDAMKTPGFLFSVPVYARGAPLGTLEQRRSAFRSLVYAPFIMTNLMDGTLAKAERHVTVSIHDGDDELYDENTEATAEFDPAAAFRTTSTAQVYGRTWTLHIQSSKSFNVATHSAQPVTILLAGIFIDLLLLAMFVMLSRGRREALAFADAANLDLVARRTELEHTNADLQQFAYVASHDLQEPLRMVTSYTGLLEEELRTVLDEDQQQYMAYVLEGGERMQRLISDLLEYSRAGRSGRALAPVSAHEAAETALANLAMSIREAGGEVRLSPLPHVMGDEGLLSQVFQNIISNALKFRGEGQPVVQIESARGLHGEVIVSIKDNGIGIAEAYQESVFGMFQRLHLRREFDGNGIGLAVCKRIIEKHGGRMWLESAAGLGTTFFFSLAPSAETL